MRLGLKRAMERHKVVGVKGSVYNVSALRSYLQPVEQVAAVFISTRTALTAARAVDKSQLEGHLAQPLLHSLDAINRAVLDVVEAGNWYVGATLFGGGGGQRGLGGGACTWSVRAWAGRT